MASIVAGWGSIWPWWPSADGAAWCWISPGCPLEDVRRDDTLLYSESAGRFIITVDPRQREAFETLFEAMPLACIGNVTEETAFVLKGTDGREIAHIDVPALASAWQKPFGDLI